jgi:hypothetical protein
MGFNARRIELALKNTAGSLDECIQWLEDNQDRLEASETKADDADNAGTSDVHVAGESNDIALETESSTQSTPVTEEEKAKKLEDLRAKAAIRKAEAAKKDAEEAKQNELLRRKNTSQEHKRREELEQKEVMKEAARRKMEARDDMLAKKRIKELIEQDKRARAEKKEKPEAVSAASAPPSTSSTSVPKPPRTEPTQAKLRLRVQSTNAQLIEVFPIDATLSHVADRVSSQVGTSADKLFFLSTFPTRKFTVADYELTLKEAGLVNASVTVGW